MASAQSKFILEGNKPKKLAMYEEVIDMSVALDAMREIYGPVPSELPCESRSRKYFVEYENGILITIWVPGRDEMPISVLIEKSVAGVATHYMFFEMTGEYITTEWPVDSVKRETNYAFLDSCASILNASCDSITLIRPGRCDTIGIRFSEKYGKNMSFPGLLYPYSEYLPVTITTQRKVLKLDTVMYQSAAIDSIVKSFERPEYTPFPQQILDQRVDMFGPGLKEMAKQMKKRSDCDD